jgi:hypothetical protein
MTSNCRSYSEMNTDLALCDLSDKRANQLILKVRDLAELKVPARCPFAF